MESESQALQIFCSLKKGRKGTNLAVVENKLTNLVLSFIGDKH